MTKPQITSGLPWQRPEFDGWVIVGMNHYHAAGARKLFVAMTNRNGNRCIQAEGPDGLLLWDDLARRAKAITERMTASPELQALARSGGADTIIGGLPDGI